MVIYVNNKNEIKDVHTTDNKSLIPLEINDEWNPFSTWPLAKICCYRVTVSDGIVTMMTPYVDSGLMERLSRLGGATDAVANDLTDTQMALIENYDQVLSVSEDLTDTQLALIENYDQTMAISEDLTDTQLALIENYDLSLSTADEVTDVQLALVEIYNMIMEMGGI